MLPRFSDKPYSGDHLLQEGADSGDDGRHPDLDAHRRKPRAATPGCVQIGAWTGMC